MTSKKHKKYGSCVFPGVLVFGDIHNIMGEPIEFKFAKEEEWNFTREAEELKSSNEVLLEDGHKIII